MATWYEQSVLVPCIHWDINLHTLSHQHTNILWNLCKNTRVNACASILYDGIGSHVIKKLRKCCHCAHSVTSMYFVFCFPMGCMMLWFISILPLSPAVAWKCFRACLSSNSVFEDRGEERQRKKEKSDYIAASSIHSSSQSFISPDWSRLLWHAAFSSLLELQSPNTSSPCEW